MSTADKLPGAPTAGQTPEGGWPPRRLSPSGVRRHLASRAPGASRHEEILLRLSRGWTRAEIADDLGVSTQTLRHDLVALRRRFDSRTDEQLMVEATRAGMVG